MRPRGSRSWNGRTRRLKKMLADAMLAKKVLEYALEKKLLARLTRRRSCKRPSVMVCAPGRAGCRILGLSRSGYWYRAGRRSSRLQGAGEAHHPCAHRREPSVRVPPDRCPAQAGRLEQPGRRQVRRLRRLGGSSGCLQRRGKSLGAAALPGCPRRGDA